MALACLPAALDLSHSTTQQPNNPTSAPLPATHHLIQEPIFVPRPGGTAEDDGWVMSLVYDADEQRTRLAILDARNLSGGC